MLAVKLFPFQGDKFTLRKFPACSSDPNEAHVMKGPKSLKLCLSSLTPEITSQPPCKEQFYILFSLWVSFKINRNWLFLSLPQSFLFFLLFNLNLLLFWTCLPFTLRLVWQLFPVTSLSTFVLCALLWFWSLVLWKSRFMFFSSCNLFLFIYL